MNVLWQLGFLVLLCGAVYVDGSNCSARCFPHPDNTSLACNTTTGDCLYGCILGFAGSDCSVNCSKNCAVGPNTNNTAVCDSVSRKCLFGCKYGFTGDNCTCPQNCAKPSGNETNTCDVETGNCTFGCNGSFAGNQCEVQCPQNCKLSTIKGNDTCNITSGNCLLGCNEGFAGPNCTFKCPQNCNPSSNKENDTCNIISGNCLLGCNEGFAGPNCTFACPQNCLTVHGNISATCNISTGECFIGCNGSFAGPNCTFECPQNCRVVHDNVSATCNINSSNCLNGCKEGFAGPNCTFKCPNNCFAALNSSSETCNISSGECLLGCQHGYAGPNCSFSCPTKCGLAPTTNAEMCDSKTGECLYGCIQGYSNTNCSHQCPANCFFPSNNSIETCDIMTDTCTFGCKHGYSGDNCSFICPSNCGVSNDFNTTTCDTNTSRCIHGCKVGYTSDDCSIQCPENCIGSATGPNIPVCDATSLNCLFGCKNEYYGYNCSLKCSDKITNCESCHEDNNSKSLNCTKCIQNWYATGAKCEQCPYFCQPDPLNYRQTCKIVGGECIFGCRTNRYGYRCEHICSSTCINPTCEQYTGVCSNGCVRSYCGSTCQSACNVGCRQGECDQLCSCSKGCYKDKWGLKCEDPCPTSCTITVDESSNICERTNGSCSHGCLKDTFWDAKCSSHCSSHCLRGICQQTSGNCSFGCSNNKVHGDKCDQDCNPKCINGTCKRDGYCEEGCVSGWFGDSCDQKCSSNCVGGSCKRFDGTCPCEIGWYGLRCESKCSTSCLSLTCQQISGNCTLGCISGYEGATCELRSAITEPPEFERKWIYVAIGGGCAVIIIVVITMTLVTRRRKQIAREKRQTLSEDELLELARRKEHRRQRGTGARLTQIFVENPLAKMMQGKTHDRILNTKFRVNEILEKIVLMDFGDFSDEFDRLPNGLTRTHEVAKRLDNLALNFYHGIYPYDENRVVLKRSPDQVVPDVTKRTGKSIKSRIAKSVHFFTFGKDDDYVTMGKETQPRPPSDKPLKSALKHSTSVHSEHEEKPIVHAIEIEPHVVDGASIEEESSGYSDVFSRNKTKEDDKKDDVNPYDNESFDAMTKELDEAVRTMNNSDYDRVDRIQDKSNKTSAQSSDSGHIYNHTEAEPPGADNAEYALVHKTSNDAKVALNPSGISAAFSKKDEKGAHQNLALSPPPSAQDSMGLKGDYINASFIKVHKDNHKFIAAQAPAKVTVVDFWLMIWEQRVQVIVMVADIPEDGFSRCEKYWPEKGQTETFDEMKITSVTDESLVDYSVRKLNLCMHGVEREVVHIQFKAWPEDGCPVSAIDFIKFHQKYRSIAKGIGHSAPIVVHCTAGVGRTGVFIGLDVLFEEGRDSGMIDVFKCVERLREQRVDMVHSVDQYEFLYKAVAQTFALECVPYNKTKVPEKLSDLKKFDESGISRLEGIHEKMRISLQLDTQEIPTVDPQQERGRKDRPTSDIPDVIFRAHLPHNAYINAFMFDSLRDKESIVVTQMPTPDTLTDFCQLLLHQHIGTIVMLNAAESNDKTMGFYWPKDKTKEVIIGTFKMTILDVNKQADFVIRKLKLESIMADDDDTGSEINMIQYKGWKVVKNLPSAKNLLKILLMAKKYAIVSADKKMLVHCLNGSDQSGLFCALYSLLETLDLEDEVSITTIVRKVLARRPGAIPTPNQLEACFATAIEYLTQKY